MHAGIVLGIALKFTIAPSFQARDDSLRLLHRPTHAEAGRCMDLPDTVEAGTSRVSELAIGTPPGRTRRIRVKKDNKGRPARLIEMSIELERDKPFAIHLVGVTFVAGKPVRTSSAHTIERGSSTSGERRTQHIRLTDDELEAAKDLAIWVLLRCKSSTSSRGGERSGNNAAPLHVAQ